MKASLDNETRLIGARYVSSGYEIPTYDDGFGPLWISRNSIGINGIVRAQTWEDAYGICEDEFFPEADETVDEMIAEYGFKREHRKVVRDSSVLVAGEHTAVGERFAEYPCDYPADGKLASEFIRWVTVETPDADAWTENELFCEAYGFRPNGPNSKDKLNHGIYAKDLNGDSLDPLTDELLESLGIELITETYE
jgi:hypothetical protein